MLRALRELGLCQCGTSLFGDASLFAQIDLGLQDVHRFQDERRRQTALRFAAGALARTGGIDQIISPAFHRVRPELGLSHRQTGLDIHVVTQLSQAADGILFAHLIQDRLEPLHVSPLKVRLHVIHDVREVLAALRLLLRELIENQLRRAARFAAQTKRPADLIVDLPGDDVLLPRRRL